MLNLAGTAVKGVSIGGLETCIQLPGLALAFDIGRCPRSAVHRSRVFFSHAHLDHLGGVPMHCATRALTGLEPPSYVLPRQNLADFQAMLGSWRRLDRSRLPCSVVGAVPGDRFPLREDLELRAFQTRHSLPSLGYAIFSLRHKLRPEYHGLPGQRLKALREAGEAITAPSWVCDVAFTGDSSAKVLDEQPWLYDARLLILETTFLDDRVGVQACRAREHVHLDEVLQRVDLFRNQAIPLTHFSARYAPSEIRGILDRRLPPSLKGRVHPLLPRRG